MSGKILKDNLEILSPLMLYLIFGLFLLPAVMFSSKMLPTILMIVAFALFTFAFCAGWFSMIFKAVEEKAAQEREVFGLWKEFFGKIPSEMLRFAFGIILLWIIFIIFMAIGQLIAAKFFGSIDFLLEATKNLALKPENTQEFLKSFTSEQLYTIYMYNFVLSAAVAIFAFLTMYLFPAMMFFNKNPFVALGLALKMLFKNFFNSLGLFLIIIFSYILLQLFFMALISFVPSSAFVSTLYLIFLLIFVAWATILVFINFERIKCKK